MYFHNHGNPSAGIYLPEKWEGNRARFSARGMTLPSEADAASLEALAPEGFYCVTEAFPCCDKNCRVFEASLLVQLGYDGTGEPILFVPEVEGAKMNIPDRGTRIDPTRIGLMVPLTVAMKPRPPEAGELMLH